MKLKYTGYANNSSKDIGKTISNTIMTQYNKGLAIKNEELAQEGIDDGDDSANIVNPVRTRNIKVIKAPQKITRATTSIGRQIPVSNTYSVPSISHKAVASKSTIKEFISESRLLDNELDLMLGMLKFNNKHEFYGDEYQGGNICGGALFTEEEKNQYEHHTDIEDLEELLEEYKDQLKELNMEKTQDLIDVDEYEKNPELDQKLKIVMRILHI
jgi:hypothetical protein